MSTSTRQTADERRVAVLAAAVTEFARAGYAGTSTEAIARRAGISQPYLFRLFRTKKDLFVATHQQVGGRIVRELTLAGEGLGGDEALMAMGMAYLELLQDPELLQVQMHGFAAATGDVEIAAACRETFHVLWHLLHDEKAIDEAKIREFFSNGMMISVMASIDLLSVGDHWAQAICPEPEKAAAIVAATNALSARRSSNAKQKEISA